MENPIVHKALEKLQQQTKIKGKWTLTEKLDGKLELRLPAGKLNFYIEVKKEIRQYQLPNILELARKYHPLMVVANNIFPVLKEQLRENKIGYLDTAGNIYIEAGNYYVWIDGNKAVEEKVTVTNRAFTKTGLKTVFYLLINRDAINTTYRNLAEATDTALGNIKNVMEGLNDAGFIINIDKDKVKLKNKRELLDRWITAYGETLKPALLAGTYKFWDIDKFVNWQQLPLKKGEDFWGGEPAGDLLTNYLTPLELTLYTENKVNLVKQWTLIPDEKGPLKIYMKFWKDKNLNPDNFVPPLLVYADLILTNDARCRETAEKIFKEYLQNEFK